MNIFRKNEHIPFPGSRLNAEWNLKDIYIKENTTMKWNL